MFLPPTKKLPCFSIASGPSGTRPEGPLAQAPSSSAGTAQSSRTKESNGRTGFPWLVVETVTADRDVSYRAKSTLRRGRARRDQATTHLMGLEGTLTRQLRLAANRRGFLLACTGVALAGTLTAACRRTVAIVADALLLPPRWRRPAINVSSCVASR
jgi:hypothetical protein